MSVLIKGMEIPKSCMLCPFCMPEANEDNGEICVISGQFPLMNKEERNIECPLVEIPPHGDLIDINELKKKIIEPEYMDKDDFWDNVLYQINHAPVVIEAEGGEA